MKVYYDPIYGRIELDDFIVDVIQKCPELKRLKYIGMMNFKAISMLPLTSITRLEHTIGLAYLTQLFAETNNLSSASKRDMILSALYHDVNCGSFGHSVEWAIDRYTPFDHEKDTAWLSSQDSHPYFINLPRFIEMPGLHRFDFGEKYKPDFNKIYKIIKGTESFVINNKGIDLDNIDNVFRMAFYLGIFPEDRSIVADLVRNLRVVRDIDNFIINKTALNLIDTWHKLRSDIYHRFIYSKEYMGFEFLIFQLIYEFSKSVDSDDVKNLFHFTDEKLLWSLTDKKKYPHALNTIAKKLLLHDLPKAHTIIRSDNFEKKDLLGKEDVLKSLAKDVIKSLSRRKNISTSVPIEIYYHVTTDNRKTNRRVDIYVDDNGSISKKSIGDDRSYILICILTRTELPGELASLITRETIEQLNKTELGVFEQVDFSEHEDISTGHLF
ncbi:MAG: hypothetical protein L6290_00445 [Thermodesulfovibrionales bacterium]|nr:hypothetical protein [Thermodesulfovibrionales bacterium]